MAQRRRIAKAGITPRVHVRPAVRRHLRRHLRQPAARMPTRLPVAMSQRAHTHRRSMQFRRNRTTAHITLLLTIVLRRNMRWRRAALRRHVALLQLRTAIPRVAARRHTSVNTRCNRMRMRLAHRALRVLPVVEIRPGGRVAAGKVPTIRTASLPAVEVLRVFRVALPLVMRVLGIGA